VAVHVFDAPVRHRRRVTILVHFVCLGFGISLTIEGHEEDEILDSCDGEHEGGGHRVVTVVDEWLKSVEEDKDKLYKLECRQVFLPPEIALYRGSTGCQKVVQVHQCVDTRV